MKQTISLSTHQQFAFSPQIQQTVRMLQLGAFDLSKEIDETLNNNPLIKETILTPANRNEYADNWLNNMSAETTPDLTAHLFEQLELNSLSTTTRAQLRLLINLLDGDGYLRLTEQELIQQFNQHELDIDKSKLNSLITQLRNLEPYGIAARNLSECLSAQIRPMALAESLKAQALLLCQEVNLLAQKNKKRLVQKLNINPSRLDQLITLIQSLDPKPGKLFTHSQTQFIQPDIYIEINDDRLSMRLNPSITRTVELNQNMIRLLQESNNIDDKVYLKNNLKQARWWINALERRNITLLKVATYVVEFQQAFFKQGVKGLKPLTQQSIAQTLDLHVSTVSRAMKNKYLQTPNGIMTLKYFLAGKSGDMTQNNLSNMAVKALIENIIRNEPSQNPLSDAKIVIILKDRGIFIARRTISKYREQLNIPASARRNH